MKLTKSNLFPVVNDSMFIGKSGDVYSVVCHVSSGWQQKFLLLADVHFDSKHCNRKLLQRHLNEAKACGAAVMIFGDVFDCMGGKYDKRTNKEDLRPEYQRANYFDVITDDAAEFFSPYKDNIMFVSYGNHEHSVMARHEIDLIRNFVDKLNPNILVGKYDGFLKYTFYSGVASSTNMVSKVMYYNHGSGGNSPITKGVINTARRQTAIMADYYVTGHLHNEWEVPLTRVRVTAHDTISIDKVKHWQLGTYASTFGGGWESRMGFSAQTEGGRWWTLRYVNSSITSESMLAE